MRLRQRITILLCTVILILSLAAAPALAGITVQLNFDGNGIVYEGTPITIRATVYDENGILITNPAVEWSLGNPGYGTLNAVYGEATCTPVRPSSLGRWDSVVTVTRAAYGGATAELPLTIYPGEAKDDPLARAKVYLRGRQATDGKLADDWAAIALAAAGENLSANDWLKGGRGHLDIVAKAVCAWNVNTTPTTDVARTLLAVATARKAGAGVDPRNFGGKDLVALLMQRQDAGSGHFGLPGEAAWVNTHVWAILALSGAGAEIPRPDLARQWLLDKQNGDGGWGWTTDRQDPYQGYLSDSNDTAAAIRALVVLGVTDKSATRPLGRALSFLKTMQAEDGGFFYGGGWASPSDANSDAEVIQVLAATGEDPQGAGWSKTGDRNAVLHLLGLQRADGSFRWQADYDGFSLSHNTALAVLALSCLDGADLPEVPPAPSGGGGGAQEPDTITVTAEVRGLDGKEMYPRRPVELGPGEQTPLGALEALGARVTTGFGGGYVVAIDGLAEKQYGPTSGWIYLVNGSSPPAAADAYALDDGDDVLWRYVRSLAEALDTYLELQPGPPLPPALADRAEAVEEALHTVPGNQPATVVLPSSPLAAEEATALAGELAANRVDLAREAGPATETLVADALLEAGVRIPVGALDQNVTVSILERDAAPGAPAPLGRTFASGVYDFGPDGQVFRGQVTVYIRCLPGEGREPADLTLAWFDPQAEAWRPLPAVYDPATGLLAGHTTHFTRFAALIPAGPRPDFTDLKPAGEAWYAGAVTDLAARGVIGADEGPAFRAGDPVTRATFTGWLARGLALLPGPEASFSDLGPDAAYRAEIGAATKEGLVRGRPGGLFAPADTLTRQELAAILVRAAARRHEVRDPSPDEVRALLTPYADAASVSGWARAAAAVAVREGLLAGKPGGRLDPLGPVTRAEAAAFIERLMDSERTVGHAA